MYIIREYPVAVAFCVITMLCWGSWANTSKISAKDWPVPDVLLGLFDRTHPAALLFGLTNGKHRRRRQELCERPSAGGSRINSSRRRSGASCSTSPISLIVAAISVAGLSVAFPIGVGLALVIGVVVNYVKEPRGNPLLLFGGVLLVVLAMTVNAVASSKMRGARTSSPAKGSSCLSSRNHHGVFLQVCGGQPHAGFRDT